MLRTICFLSFSAALLTLNSCGLRRPDVDVGVINVPKGYMRAYNMRDDYDDEGNRKSGAKPTTYRVKSVEDVNKWLCVNSKDGPEEAQARLIAYLRKLRETPPKCPTQPQ